MRAKSPLGDSWICADQANHTNLRGGSLQGFARAAGDMVGGGSSVAFLRGEDTKK